MPEDTKPQEIGVGDVVYRGDNAYVVEAILRDRVVIIPLRRFIEEREFVEINGEFTNIYDHVNSKMEIYLEEHTYEQKQE